jgi:hypothetical protein
MKAVAILPPSPRCRHPWHETILLGVSPISGHVFAEIARVATVWTRRYNSLKPVNGDEALTPHLKAAVTR